MPGVACGVSPIALNPTNPKLTPSCRSTTGRAAADRSAPAPKASSGLRRRVRSVVVRALLAVVPGVVVGQGDGVQPEPGQAVGDRGRRGERVVALLGRPVVRQRALEVADGQVRRGEVSSQRAERRDRVTGRGDRGDPTAEHDVADHGDRGDRSRGRAGCLERVLLRLPQRIHTADHDRPHPGPHAGRRDHRHRVPVAGDLPDGGGQAERVAGPVHRPPASPRGRARSAAPGRGTPAPRPGCGARPAPAAGSSREAPARWTGRSSATATTRERRPGPRRRRRRCTPRGPPALRRRPRGVPARACRNRTPLRSTTRRCHAAATVFMEIASTE